MSGSRSDVIVRDNTAAHRYEAQVQGRVAFIAYRRSGDQIIFLHTEVPAELEGQGIAGRMAQVALDDARAQALAVIPRCPFVAGYIRRHSEYLDLVPPDARERLVKT